MFNPTFEFYELWNYFGDSLRSLGVGQRCRFHGNYNVSDSKTSVKENKKRKSKIRKIERPIWYEIGRK